MSNLITTKEEAIEAISAMPEIEIQIVSEGENRTAKQQEIIDLVKRDMLDFRHLGHLIPVSI